MMKAQENVNIITNVLRALIVIIFTATIVFTLVGCGSNDDEEYYDDSNDSWEEEEYSDPYVDGMTLEEAKEWEDCSVFIMDNDVFYPLLPAYWSGFYLGTSVNKNRSDDTAKLYYTSADYAEYRIPELSEGRKLVEVRQENESDIIYHMSGKAGWTVPYTFSYVNKNFEAEWHEEEERNEYYQEIIGWDNHPYPAEEIPSGAELRAIDGNDISFDKLNEVAKEVGNIDDSWCAIDGTEPKRPKIINNTDWTGICEESGLEPMYAGVESVSGFTADMIIDMKKGDEVDLSFRADNSVDTEDATVIADFRYFNLPKDVNAVKPAKGSDVTYTETDDGYSIINTDSLNAGIYIYEHGTVLNNSVFRIK